MKKYLIILILLPSICFCQKANLDTNHILIGDHVELTISSNFKTNEKYTWPLFTDSIFKKLEILQKSKISEIKSDSINNISQKIILTCFDSGIYYIPPFVFNETKQTDSLILKVETIKITDSNNYAYDITKTLIGTSDDYTEKEILERRKKRLIILGFIIGIILLAFLVYILIKKFKKEPLFEKTKILIPAHVLALKKLKKLKKSKLSEKGEIKEFYSKISLIIREYIENRYQFNALELPTSEIISKLQNEPKENIEILENILRKADNIKYAKGLSHSEENKLTMNKSIDFILKTKVEKNGNNI